MHMAPVAMSLPPDVEVEVRAGERVECSLYVPNDGATIIETVNPDSLLAFQHMFPDDDACAAWLIEDGAGRTASVCPACGHEKGWALRQKSTHLRVRPAAAGQTSVTAQGRVLHASKLPLTVWFWAAYLMATHSNGISALQLQKQLGIGSLPQRLAARPKLMRQHGRPPSATRLVGPGGNRP